MSRNKLKSALVPYGFITPATLTIVLLVLYPIMYGIYISFFDTNLVNKWNFVGFKYYIQALTDSSFLHSLWKTLVFTVTVVGGHFVLGFIFASFLNMDIKMRTLLRGILILPWLFPDVVIAYLYKWILNTQGGILNELLMHFNIASEPVGWLTTSATAFPCVILVSIWKGYPLVMVQILAGIQTISTDMYEAAKIDGANAWQRFRYITWPQLQPTTFFVTIILTINCFKVYDIVYMLAGGNAGVLNESAIVLVYHIYEEAFRNWNLGYASAVAMVLFLIVLAITLVQFRGEKKYSN